jgi:hypothetical protein
MLTRHEGWVNSLYEYIRSCKDKPFEYGVLDCARFTCGCIEAETGTDIYASFAGTYADAAGADAVMESTCGTADIVALVEAVTAKYEMKEIPVLFAQRGDVVLLAVDGGVALGIVALDGVNVAAVSAEGLHRVPITYATRAWKV